MDAAFGIMSIVYLALIVFWVWTLIDILKNEFSGSGKIVWLLVVFFLSLLGSILYVAIGRKQRVI
ncbi:MAG: PLDc N-terminal domain-containing protein [Campylobacterota bacterium]|nr:PLDc N-terminal domain-containing protein [Campylobacterota bacterium]